MNTPTYQRFREPKSCFLPTCSNNDVKNPALKFVVLRKGLKENWCQLVNRNCPKRKLFCCEEHINFEEDLENYQNWISGAHPKLKLNATLKNITKKAPPPEASPTASTSRAMDIRTACSINVAVQCENKRGQNRSVMVKPDTKDKSTNFRGRKVKQRVMPSIMSHLPDSDDAISPCTSPSLFGASNIDSTTSSGALNYDGKRGREHLMKLIENNPNMYLGLPKNCWWAIDYIVQEYSCVALYIIITLFKLKNNDSFVRMSEEFQIARSTIRVMFTKNVSILSTFFQNFIYLPTLKEIKENLPLVFKIRYSNVQCIIDCFEIEIEKPTDPVNQAHTWSQYKHCNTMKYLIGGTPAGYICFISAGYGGRTSDKAITEKSGFIDILPINSIIMADRGFKEIEALLSIKNVKLLRPPSVYGGKKLTKKEVIQTKVIASLRVHVERVINRIRQFHMLKSHSVVNNKHLKYLDDLVIIACGLINLQDPIIKEY